MKPFRIRILFFGCLLLMLAAVVPQRAHAQAKNSARPATVDSTAIRDSIIMSWLKNIYAEGVSVTNDSVAISPETKRLLTDKEYREVAYPKTYTWDMVVNFIKKQELKLTFWYMINLYMGEERDKQAVIKSLLMYDKLFKMDKVLTNTFYTYIFADPQIGTIENGHSKITAPQVMDKKLNALKEILYYLDKYRAPQNKTGQMKH